MASISFAHNGSKSLHTNSGGGRFPRALIPSKA